jgi:hypothetical protein
MARRQHSLGRAPRADKPDAGKQRLRADTGGDRGWTAAPPDGQGTAWLAALQRTAATAAGHGTAIAPTLALASTAIGVAVVIDWRRNAFLVLAAALNLSYWVLGQGFGVVLTGSATDPNAGPLFILLALAIHRLPQNCSPGRQRCLNPLRARCSISSPRRRSSLSVPSSSRAAPSRV